MRTDSVEIGADEVIYAGDDRGRIAIIEEGRLSFVSAHQAGIKKIALDARLGVLVSLSYDRSIAIWRIDEKKQLQEWSRSTLPEDVWARAATVLPDGRIATGTFGTTYAIFDPQTSTWDLQGVVAGPAINAVLSTAGKTYSVGDAGVVFVDGIAAAEMGSLCNFLVAAENRIYTGGQMGQLFDAQTGKVLHQHHSPLNCAVAFEKDGAPHVAIGSYTGDILVFALLPDGGLQPVVELSVYENAIKGLSYSNGQLFSVCASTDIAWHCTNDWTLVKRIAKAHDRIANACCAIGEGQFATVSRDRTLRLWGDGDDEIHESPHPNSVKCISVNGDRTVLLTGSYGGTLALFDLARKRWTAVMRPTVSGISSITWDEARKRFLASSYDGHIYPVHAFFPVGNELGVAA